VKEFYRWAFLNTRVYDPIDEEELEEYVEKFEETHGWKLEPGFGNANCLRLTLGQVNMVHRSLACIWCIYKISNARERLYVADPLEKLSRQHEALENKLSCFPSTSIVQISILQPLKRKYDFS
jgi:hypothetical protein